VEEKKVVLKVLALHKEMLKTKTKFDDLLERYKDLDPVYVNDKLEEYDDLVQYNYTILHTKQQMGNSNVELNEW
jgi:hypothetical protein